MQAFLSIKVVQNISHLGWINITSTVKINILLNQTSNIKKDHNLTTLENTIQVQIYLF